MKKIFFTFTALVLALGMVACASRPALDDGHSSRISVDWEGTYTGTIPAADGPGIKVQLTIRSDETYELRYEYIDREDSIFTEQGRFTWDESGGIIKLDVKNYPPYYQVGENTLVQLDMEGERITGSLADSYVLTKFRD